MDENVEKLREYLCTIRKALSCYQCKKICIEPWIVRCGHNFCKKCIQDLRNLDRNCPRCVLQPITRRGVRQNEELEKVITQFHNFEDAFKADTQFDVTQDGFVPSHIIYGSSSFEDNLRESPLNNVGPSSGQESNKAPGRKNSVPETEYFRRFKSLTFRKDRIVSEKSPTRDKERNSVEVEGLRDEEEGQSLSYHVSEDNRLLTEEKEIRKAADDGEREQENEEEQKVAKERSLRLSSHEASQTESDEDLEEQNEEEQNRSEERSLSLSSHEASRVESDKILEVQNEEEQNVAEERNFCLSRHEASRVESDKSLEEQNEEEQNVAGERSLRLSSHETSPVESDESLEEQNEEEQNVAGERSFRLSSHETSPVESDESLEEQNEEEQNVAGERSFRLSSHETSPVESDESLEEQNEEEQNGSEERSLSLLSHESSRTEYDGFEKQNKEEQNGSEERSLSLSSHEASRVESDKISLEEQNEEGQSSRHESDQVESDEDEDTDSLEESLRSSSHISDEIEPYKVEEISIKKELPYSDNELHIQDMDMKPIEKFEVSDSKLHKSQTFDPFPGLVKTTSESNTEIEPLEESVIFLESADAEKKSSNWNHTVDLVSPPTFDSQNVHKILVRKRKTLDRVSNPSKTAKQNKIRKKVLFLYCGKLSRHYKSLVDKDIVTVLSPGEMKNNLGKKSPMNRNLLDFGFKRLRGNLNLDTSKVNENSLLGKRKRSVLKAKNVLENFKGDEGTQNVDDVFLNHSGTTEDLSDFRNKLENNVDKQKPPGTSRNRSIISESELTTESLSTRQIRMENQKAREKLKMQKFYSAFGIIDPLQVQGEFLNLDFNQKNRVEEQNQIKTQPSSYEMKTAQIVPELFVNRVEDSHQRPIEQIRASAEEDICESFHIEKFLAFNKGSQGACTFEDGDDRVEEKLILPSDGSKTPNESFFLEKTNKPSGGIIAESGVIILSSDDDEDSSKEQDYLALPVKQEPSTLPDESDTKIKTPRGVRRTNDNSLGWRIKRKIAKE